MCPAKNITSGRLRFQLSACSDVPAVLFRLMKERERKGGREREGRKEGERKLVKNNTVLLNPFVVFLLLQVQR